MASVRSLLTALAVLCSAALTVTSAAVSSSEICSSAEFQALTPTALGSGPVTIKTLIVGDQVCLEFALTSSVASSAGWFAVGISTSNSMVSSPKKTAMLFQKSVAQPQSYILGGYTRNQVSKESDQTTFVVGSASATTMTFSYQRTLVAASSTSVEIVPGKQMSFIWAYDTMWPISAHGDNTMGTAKYTFTSSATSSSATPSSSSSSTTTITPTNISPTTQTTTTNSYSAPFCDGKNCTAIVGGIAFLVMVVAGVFLTTLLQKTLVGHAFLHRTLASPPVKSTTNSLVGSPWTIFLQNVADLRLGEAFIVLLFVAAVVLLVVLLMNETKAVVSGQVAVLVLMFLLLPVSRVKLWSIFFGSSFERIVKFHRWLGMLMTVAVIVHAIFALKLTRAIQTEKYGEVTPLFGFIAFVCFVLMAVLANEYMRRKAFEVFYVSHRVLSVVGLVFAILHAPKLIGVALVVPIAFYVIGLLIHWCVAYTSTYQANVSVHQSSGATSLVLQASDKTRVFAMKMTPGAYFWVKIPSLSHTQWHPFSAIVTPDGGSVGFCIKAMGNKSYTRALLEDAQKQHTVAVSLSGPVGKMSVDVDRYDVVILVAGGVGITPMLSMINQKRLFPAEQSVSTASASAKSPDWFVVWSTHEASHLLAVEDFMPSHAQLDYAASSAARASLQDPNVPMIGGNAGAVPPLNVNWSLHVSTAKSEGTVMRENGDVLPYKAGRPVLDETINNSRFVGRRVAVVACGPPTMCVEAQALARQCGFDFHKEVFNW